MLPCAVQLFGPMCGAVVSHPSKDRVSVSEHRYCRITRHCLTLTRLVQCAVPELKLTAPAL